MLDPHSLVGLTIDNRYQLVSVAGQGGFGTVFEAQEVVLGDVIGYAAIKLVPGSSDADRQAMMSEVRTISQFSHPHLLAYRGAGSIVGGPADGCLYLATELAAGTLADRLQRPQPLTEEEVAEVALHLAQALAYLHGRQAVHRDVKPANLFLVGDQWKLGDFGMVCGFLDTQVAVRCDGGTPLYMAPEALCGHWSGPACDVWALGAIVQQCLSGCLPYDGRSQGELVAEASSGPPRVACGLTEPYQSLVAACLQPEPDRRWSAQQAIECLGPPTTSRVEVLVREGDALMAQERYDLAADRYRRSLLMAGSNGALHAKLANALARLGLWADSETEYRSAVRYEPTSGEYHRGLGEALANQQRFPDAVAELESAVRYEPRKHASVIQLGHALYACGRYADSAFVFREATRLRKKGADGHLGLGRALLGLGLYNDAEEPLRIASGLIPGETDPLDLLAQACMGQGHYADALMVYDQAAALAPNDPAPLRGAGAALSALGRAQEAVDIYNRVLAMCEGEADVYVRLGEALAALRRHREAVAAFHQAVDLAPNDREIADRLRRALDGARQDVLAMIDWVDIPEGQFLFGVARSPVQTAAYRIMRTPVTVGMYREYCAASGVAMPPKPAWGWRDEMPVVNVSWHEASRFCCWLGGKLPGERQWEKAARGVDGRHYPWGDGFRVQACACSVGATQRGTVPVASFAADRSPFGCFDMAGNVKEWTAARMPGSDDVLAVRGGSWATTSDALLQLCRRDWIGDDVRSNEIGFRCVLREPAG